MATIVLHNFLHRGTEDILQHERRYVETGVCEYVNENGALLHNEIPCDLRSAGQLGSNNPSKTVKEARDELADYFVRRFLALAMTICQTRKCTINSIFNSQI